jgi:hypothetical protein
MKKILKIYSLGLVIAMMLNSCSDYLDLPATNEQSVSQFQDVKTVLASYLQAFETKGNYVNIAYQGSVYNEALFENEDILMFSAYSDGIDYVASMPKFLSPTNFAVPGEREQTYGEWLLFNDFRTPEKLWNKYYSIVGFMNGMLDRALSLPGGTEDEHNQVIGEIYVHRAYHLFKLLQWFAPYDKADKGIPVYLNTGQQVVGISNPRLPQSEVYAIILKDLLAAEKLISITQPDTYNQFFKERYIHNLLAQVYWFKAESGAKEGSDYANAKNYAEKAVDGVDEFIPTTLDQIHDIWNNRNINYPAFYNQANLTGGQSAIWGTSYHSTYLDFQPKDHPMSSDFISLFDDNDIRKQAYFNDDGLTLARSIIDGTDNGSRKLKYHVFMPENAYLILAESKYRLGDEAGAIEIVNKIRGFKSANAFEGISGQDLLNEIINERRREFFSKKDMRWLDLKRYANKTIERTISLFGKVYTVKVEPNGYHYALPIPLDELRENPAMDPNEGWTLIEF